MIVGLDNLDDVVNLLQNKIDSRNVIVLLRGDLASGKTTFVKRFVKKFGLNDLVTSPTFALQSNYGEQIYHYDLYNKGLHEFVALGMLEEFEKTGIHFVEWGEEDLESLLKEYGYETMVLKITKYEDKREYEIA